MSAEKPEDENVTISYIFTPFTVEEMERWIDVGYFKDHSDIAAIAFGMVQKAVRYLEQSKKVVDFNSVIIKMEVDVPEDKSKHTLQ